jgi:hypothetical protein
MGRCDHRPRSAGLAALALASLLALTSCGTTQKSPSASGTTSTTTTTTSLTANPPTATPSYAVRGCYSSRPQPPMFDRPTTVRLRGCASTGLWLLDLSWTSWGPQGADGTGTTAVDTCLPSCDSKDAIEKDPVVVHASNPEPAPPSSGCPTNVMFYRDLVLAFPQTVPPSAQVPIDTPYQGMPAIHNPADVRAICE